MRGYRLGRTLLRAGRQASRAVVPGIAAAVGTLTAPLASYGQSAPPVTNCVPEPAPLGTAPPDNCVGSGGSTPGTAAPLSVPTGNIDIPSFSGSQFYSFKIPADSNNLEVDVGVAGNDPDLNAFLVLTVGGELGKEVVVPLLTVGSNAATIASATGAATLVGGGSSTSSTVGGGGGGAATIFGGGGSTFPGSAVLSFGSLLIDHALGNLTVLGGSGATITAGGQAATFSSGGGGNSTFIASGGESQTLFGGGFFTVSSGLTFFVSGNNTISGSNTIGGNTFFEGDHLADDVIVGIDLEDRDASISGAAISFSERVDAPVATPEPGTLGLLASALAGLGLLRRRRS